MSCNCGNLGIRNKIQWISSSSVFSDIGVRVIHISGGSLEANILQNSSKLDSVEDFWFFFLTEINTLSVTTSFYVENSVISPDVFIITDEEPVTNCTQSCFSSSRETKEEGDVSILTNIAAGVERKMSLLGHQVVHDGENTLLHLTCILRAKDHHLSLLEVKRNCLFSHNAGDVLVGVELSCVEDVVVGSIAEVSFKLLKSRSHQHVVHKQGMVSSGADYSHSDSIFDIPTSIAIDDIKSSTGVEEINGKILQYLERAGRYSLIDVSPSNFSLSDGIVDE